MLEAFDLRSASDCVGYVNSFNMTREWVLGRLVYTNPSETILGVNVHRSAQVSAYLACWPFCPDVELHRLWGVCPRVLARDWCVRSARLALAARL